jgi:hypothetical protein
MSEIDFNQTIYLALNALCTRFSESPLSSSAELNRVGLRSYECHSHFDGWNGREDFFGSSFIYFLDEKGHAFFWKVGVLFEQGGHEEVKWEQGAVYSYVSISTRSDTDEQVYYQVGDNRLPCIPLKTSDLTQLSHIIKQLCDTCYEDLTFVFEFNGFSKLIELAGKKQKEKEAEYRDAKSKGSVVTAIYDPDELNGWESNPLRSNYYA